MKNSILRNTIINGILISMALILSYIERLFPVGLIVPIPGIKLGLTNIVTIFALFYLGFKSAALIAIFRCVISSMLFGSVYSFLFSLSGAIVSLVIMMLLMKGYNRYFSIFGISIAGAAAHNIGQIIVASVILKSIAVLPYLSILLLSSIITGAFIGLVSGFLIEHLDKNIFIL